MKKGKKIILSALFLLAVFSGLSNAQTLEFCEGVSNSGKAITPSTVFNIEPQGGSLKILVTLPYELRSSQVRYEVYSVDPYGEEKYDNTIYQDTEQSWSWFWKEVTFYNTGRFNVYVYDDGSNLLASGQVRIQYF